MSEQHITEQFYIQNTTKFSFFQQAIWEKNISFQTAIEIYKKNYYNKNIYVVKYVSK